MLRLVDELQVRLGSGAFSEDILSSVYTAFRFFVLSNCHLGQFCSVPWSLRLTIVFWPNRSVGVPPCPARPLPATLHDGAQTRPNCGTSWFWNRQLQFRKVTVLACLLCFGHSSSVCQDLKWCFLRIALPSIHLIFFGKPRHAQLLPTRSRIPLPELPTSSPFGSQGLYEF